MVTVQTKLFKLVGDKLICMKWRQVVGYDGNWENTKPFVGRYLDYIIVYADLLMLSDLIGTIGVSNFSNISNISNISSFSNFSKISNKGKKENKKNLEKLEKLEKLVKLAQNGTNYHLLNVTSEYVTQAFELLKPSLEYVCNIVRFVNEDLKVARVQSIFERHSPLSRSIAMKYCKLIKKDFDDAMSTLKDREEIFELIIIHTDKQTRSLTVYCHSRCIGTNQCKKCKYKCEKNQRNPKI